MGKIIEFKYDIGDVVRFKGVKFKIKREECQFCGGKGQVKGLDGTYNFCPVCDGDGKIETEVEEKVEMTGTISSMHVHYDSCYWPEGTPFYHILRYKYQVKEEDILYKLCEELMFFSFFIAVIRF